MPWTFSLFHCSSPYDGGELPLALPYGVRTFLPQALIGPELGSLARTFALANLSERAIIRKTEPQLLTPSAIKINFSSLGACASLQQEAINYMIRYS